MIPSYSTFTSSYPLEYVKYDLGKGFSSNVCPFSFVHGLLFFYAAAFRQCLIHEGLLFGAEQAFGYTSSASKLAGSDGEATSH